MTDLLLFFALCLLVMIVNNTANIGKELFKINKKLEKDK